MNKLYRILHQVFNWYGDKGFSDNDKWFNQAKTKKDFSKTYLELAKDTNYIKLKKIVNVVEEVNYYAKSNNLRPDDIRIFDAGCGAGVYTNILGWLGYHVIGVDLNIGMVEAAKKRAKSLGVDNVRFIHSNAIEYLEKHNESFDAIIALDALEHMDRVADFCRLAYMRLSSSGIFIVIVPNGYSLIELIYHPLMDIVNERIERKKAPIGWVHIQRFSLKKIRRIFEEWDFKVEKIYPIYSSLFAPLFLFGFRGRLALLNLKIADICPKIMAGSWMVVGVKGNERK